MIFWTKSDGKTYVTVNSIILVHDTMNLALDYVNVRTALFRNVTLIIERADIKHIELDGVCRIYIDKMESLYQLDSRKCLPGSALIIAGKEIDIFV